MKQAFLRLAPAAIIIAATTPAFAQGSKIDAADTAWMIGATGLVLMMTIPGLALFYAGMVRKKNVLATMAQSLAATFLISIVWAVIGYTLAFTGEGAFIGTLDRIFLNGVTLDAVSPLAKTIPESLFMIYQMTFAIITVALVAGAVADRLRFAAFLLFCVFWLLLVYVPVAHWVWGGGFLGTYGLIDFAGGTVVHLNAGVAGLVAAYVLGARRQLTRCNGDRIHASCRECRCVHMDGAGMVDARQAVGAWNDLRCNRRSRHDHARIRIRAADAGPADRNHCRRYLLLGLHLAQTQDRIRRLARRVRCARHRRLHRHTARRRIRCRRALCKSGDTGRNSWSA